MMVSTSSRKSLEPSVFRVKSEEQGDVLVGSQCQKCKRVYFPSRKWCAACLEPTCEEVELNREGTLVSFSLVDRKTAYTIVEPPYVLGEVLLPEGPHIYTTINLQSEVSPEGVRICSTVSRDNLDSLGIGQRVKLSPVVIKRAEEGHDIVAYNFNTIK